MLLARIEGELVQDLVGDDGAVLTRRFEPCRRSPCLTWSSRADF